MVWCWEGWRRVYILSGHILRLLKVNWRGYIWWWTIRGIGPIDQLFFSKSLAVRLVGKLVVLSQDAVRTVMRKSDAFYMYHVTYDASCFIWWWTIRRIGPIDQLFFSKSLALWLHLLPISFLELRDEISGLKIIMYFAGVEGWYFRVENNYVFFCSWGMKFQGWKKLCIFLELRDEISGLKKIMYFSRVEGWNNWLPFFWCLWRLHFQW